ncbi:hypothetical protein P154DRAFT_485533 [Amniculicola lignicola CBS 123094]|uniref:Uncharacterized protein n=1 Tax=Amniculicola lignicola CBS 123094 TaxID=1392246 RepID=A0A6A5WRZ1_9PLEO|nr:hypothetical protein P154DRAFT_485533 [Amniculicola lignicola CBS 123094]
MMSTMHENAFATLEIARTIVQFIQFGWDLLAEAEGNRSSVKYLVDISEKLRFYDGALTITVAPYGCPIARQLKIVADEALEIVQDLLASIKDLEEGVRKWSSFIEVLTQVWQREKILALTQRLGKLHGQVQTQLLAMMNDTNSEVFKTVQNLQAQSRVMETRLTLNLSHIRQDIINEIQNLDSNAALCTALVHDVSQAIKKLQPVKPDNLAKLSATMEQISQNLSAFHSEGQLAARGQMILKSLCSPVMGLRESAIVGAHAKTFEWIFQEEAEEAGKQSKFSEWLASQADVYWISGKAGSGKSTLMKFLFHHPRVRDRLSRWAGGHELIMANFFFWNAGTTLQKSQEGLLQSLLYEVLRQYPALIPELCSNRTEMDAMDGYGSSWTIREILQCFQQLKLTTRAVKVCYFIDGLDEYDGEHMDLINALRNISNSPNIKICASSRPWFVFRDEFGTTSWKLTLEDLTRGDITRYVREQLKTHQRFHLLRQRDQRYEDLVEQIVNKAQGVFLWVFLVVRSLMRGFTNADSIADLQRRVSLLPSSLEDYFRHIFDSIEDVYRIQTLKMFQYALHPPKNMPHPLLVFSFLDEEDPDFAFERGIEPISIEEIEHREEEMRRRLDGRTKGILETSSLPSLPGQRKSSPVNTVQFLHRSARDFLFTKDMQAELSKGLDADFNPKYDLCKAFFAYWKVGRKFDSIKDIQWIIGYALQLELTTPLSSSIVLNALEKEFKIMDNCFPLVFRDIDPVDNFLGYLVNEGFVHQASKRLKQAHAPKSRSNGLLGIALHYTDYPERDFYGTPDDYLCLKLAMTKLLLDYGANPNALFTGRKKSTIWRTFIASGIQRLSEWDSDKAIRFQIIKLLIERGAYVDEDQEIRDRIRELFPDDADWLFALSPQHDPCKPEFKKAQKGKKPSQDFRDRWLSRIKKSFGGGKKES